MDLKDNKITVMEMFENPRAKAILRRNFPELLNPFLFQVAKKMTLESTLKLSYARYNQEQMINVLAALKALWASFQYDKNFNEVDSINLNGEFITHKAFGRGQIIEHGDGFVEVLFSERNEKKKFIYPASIQTFLRLESTVTAKEYKTYSDGIASDHAMAQKDAADRLTLEKLAVKEHAKQLKKAMKKSVKKVKDEIDYYETWECFA